MLKWFGQKRMNKWMGGCADRHFKKYSSAEVKNNLFRDIFLKTCKIFRSLIF